MNLIEFDKTIYSLFIIWFEIPTTSVFIQTRKTKLTDFFEVLHEADWLYVQKSNVGLQLLQTLLSFQDVFEIFTKKSKALFPVH